MDFFTSQDITLNAKLLELIYIFIGLICLYTGIKNFKDKTNKNRIGTSIFWCLLGVVIGFGNWIPNKINGALIIILTLPAIFKKVGTGEKKSIPQEKIQESANKIGIKLFLPALSIGIFAIIFALLSFSPLVGIGVGVIVGIILLRIYSKENTINVFLNEAADTLSILGPLSLMPLLLASLGSIFEKAGVGQVISKLVSYIVPEGNVTIGIIVFALGMVLFTMIMGNAFAAITVMLVGVAQPFVLQYGANPIIIGMIGLTAGYCGTLLTPMAANFNILPVAMLDMKDRFGVIKNQILLSICLLVFQIMYMIIFS
ncbi:MAG: DUF979 domain-containing protein [Clostridiales bacterium]|nr:DUF979 domain-containing protein [Clostridiales bacterium]